MDNNFISLSDYRNITKSGDLSKLDRMKFVQTPKLDSKNDVVELTTRLVEAKNQNGLIEKLADKIKNKTKIGFSSKKIENSIKEAEQGKKSKEEVIKEIKNYRRSQENTAQAVADVVSVLALSAAFFAGRNLLIKSKALGEINLEKNKEAIMNGVKKIAQCASEKIQNTAVVNDKINSKLSDFLKDLQDEKVQEKIFNKILNINTVNLLSTIPAIFLGAEFKKEILKLNRFKTKQYKPEIDKKSMSKKEIKQIKKANKKAKRNANFRNGLTGAINGFSMASIVLLGPVAVPFYLGVNSLSRYFIGNREDKGEKSIKSYIENLKASKVTNLLAAAAMAVPLIKSGKYTKVLEKNVQLVTDELIKANLQKRENSVSAYQELQEILFSNKDINAILEDSDLFSDDRLQDKIKKLRDNNIFALKFKQIANDGDELTAALREKCPQTWNLEQAQEEVEKTYGAGKYKLKKCVGTGTVAQTFVAEDEKGNNVCIKMIHQGITKEKITKDKEAFISMINSSEKSQNEKEFLIKNVENIAQGIEKEINLQNEMESAQKLAQTTKMANVVKPIEVKDNIYVMERADGISLADFNDFGQKFYYAKLFNDTQELEKLTKEFKDKIGIDIDFDDLSKQETIKMISRYQDVLNEQFSKVNRDGKIIHGDIHPGNIFIDVKKLKAGDKNFFTLIDTGNTIEQSSSQALRFMNLTKYIANGDVDNITDFVLDGAKLPEGMSLEKAKEIISGELNKIFFDNETSIGLMNNDLLLNMCDNIMKKANIIPSDTQGSLLKAKQSSENSLMQLYEAYQTKFREKVESSMNDINKDSKSEMMAAALQVGVEAVADIVKIQESNKIKKILIENSNLLQMTPAQRMKLKRSANTPKSNSKEALTYKFKQFIMDLKSYMD